MFENRRSSGLQSLVGRLTICVKAEASVKLMNPFDSFAAVSPVTVTDVQLMSG